MREADVAALENFAINKLGLGARLYKQRTFTIEIDAPVYGDCQAMSTDLRATIGEQESGANQAARRS